MSTPSSWLSQRSSARQELTELSVTMRSKDRAVDMTVGPQGEPTTWRFLNSGHQAMSGQAPAVGVPEARATGRHEVTLRETTRFEELTGTGLGLTRSGLKDLQLDRPLEPLSGADLPSWMRAEDRTDPPLAVPPHSRPTRTPPHLRPRGPLRNGICGRSAIWRRLRSSSGGWPLIS
ncbi:MULTISPECIES: hypothetical protein [unclassified Streptomyces]|uniref:hypothetical protein n=1 Tax=unclassified Streptomyces TaxID=2593676 RepID=UPI00225A19DC|nr:MULTISPECIES: hypothetical protein [unclassified Streptomyces]MCX4409503.1 hypothetical protein [Streptomyces sp. NBC_01764]MCX5191268.1 hypothetical protein [Streptomyces sp. NBC_00268]